jgi:hypothetical protein
MEEYTKAACRQTDMSACTNSLRAPYLAGIHDPIDPGIHQTCNKWDRCGFPLSPDRTVDTGFPESSGRKTEQRRSETDTQAKGIVSCLVNVRAAPAFHRAYGRVLTRAGTRV